MTGQPEIEVLFDEQMIDQRVRELAAQISRDHAGKELLLVCILKGASFFSADLARRLSMPAAIDFVQVSSYGSSTVSSRTIELQKDINTIVRGKHVLLVDGIIDTGNTMDFLLKYYQAQGPASLKAVVLLDKRSRRTKDVMVDYIGFEIPDRFVVGYGLDFNEQYRNLPSIAVVPPEDTRAL